MLRDMLRQELPEALVLWERRPRIRVPRMHPALAALAGIGAQWLSLSFLRGVLLLSAVALGFPRFRTVEVTEAASWAIGAIVAFAGGGWRALVAAGVVGLALELQPLIYNPACRPNDLSPCEPLSHFAAGAWPTAVGLVLGIIGRHSVSTGGRGRLALALGASIVALAPSLVRLASVPFVGVGPTGGPAREVFSWLIATHVGAALGMGFVAGRFGRRYALAAVLMTSAYVLTWLPLLPTYLGQRQPHPLNFEAEWQSFTPVFFAFAALIGLAVGALSIAPPEASRIWREKT